MSVRLVEVKSFFVTKCCKNDVKTHTPFFPQLSNRLGSARCGADLILPSAVARTGDQSITIEGKTTASVLIVAVD